VRRALPVLLAAVLLSSCVAVTVTRARPRKGPVAAVGYVDYGGGEVRYSLDGWDWIVASRRRTALKLMRHNCGDDLVPRITDEFPRMDADAPYAGEDVTTLESGVSHYVLEKYEHLVYECRAPGAPEVAVSTAAAHPPVIVAPLLGPATAPLLAPTTAPLASPTTHQETPK
jgi:hypothetical protein